MSWGGLFFLVVIGVCLLAFIFRFLLEIARYFRLHFRRIDCPACGARIPFASKPTSAQQARLGGWTCYECGAEIDEMGVDLSPLIEAGRKVDEAKFVTAYRQDGGSPIERVINERD